MKSQWLLYLLTNLHISHLQAALLYTNNKLVSNIAYNPVQHERTKQIQLHCHQLQKGIIKIIHFPLKHQLVEILTKHLNNLNFHHFISKIGMINIYSNFEGVLEFTKPLRQS